MSTNYSKFESNLEVVVVDRKGNKTGETRTSDAPAWNYFYSGKQVVLVNWLWEGADRPSTEELAIPIVFDGKTFLGNLGWGSAVKRGYTIGLQEDVLVESGLGKKAEDGLRVQRWLFSNSLYGAGVGDLKVKVVSAGTMLNGLPVEDGFGYITKTLVNATTNGRDKIELGCAKDSFHFWQRVPWTKEVADEIKPLIEEAVKDAADPAKWLATSSTNMAEKAALCQLDKDMIEHPYVANSLYRSEKERAVRLATTAPLGGIYRVAVPTTCKGLAETEDTMLERYPIESWGNIRAQDGDVDAVSEKARINAMEVVQFTLTNKGAFASGCFGVVDDTLLDGYDIVICIDNVKMGKIDEDMVGAYLGFTQHYAAGSAIGISATLFKVMNGDFDGDGLAVVFAKAFPALYAAVKAFPVQDSLKLTKSKNALTAEKRSEMITNSMSNLVGFATNVAATTFCMEDRAFLASRLGYKDEAAMDAQLSYFIKCGTDGFKTAIDLPKVEKQVGVVQSNLATLLGKCAPWTQWRKNDWAFTHGVPEVNVKKGSDLKDPAVETGIPSHMDGTIAQIARIAMPSISNFLSVAIAAKPLSFFKGWAMPVEDELLESAGELQIKYNARTQVTNWSDPEVVGHFKAWWSHEVNAWMIDKKIMSITAAAALWRVAHNSRSTYAGAASVFMAFPAECRDIISHKPGKNVVKCVVLGLMAKVENWAGAVKLVAYEEVRGKMRISRKAIVLPDATLMKYDKAVIPVDSEAPDAGEYNISITRRSAASWEARFC